MDRLLAKAVYSSGCPLRLVEDKCWQNFFNAIRPSYKIPSRYDLGHKLLDNEYDSVQDQVKAKILMSSNLALQCDGWTNIRNESILNFVVTTPEPVLLKTMTTGVEKHTGDYIASELKKCIYDIDPSKVFGVISDNASAMEKAKKIISEEFQHITPYSCIAHTLNLLIGDIMKLSSLKNVEHSCKDIIKEITNSHRNLATFNMVQKNKYGVTKSLKLPVKTRWGSILYCIESLIRTKEALQIFIISENENIKFSRTVRDNILDNDIFWVRLEKIKKILQPIVKWITVLEGDQLTISKVFLAVKEIENSLNNEVKSLPIKSTEEKELLSIFENRKKMMLKPLHLAAYLLDPKYCGSQLNSDQHIQAMEFIDKILSVHPKFKENRDSISTELTYFLAKKNLWRLPFVWESANKTDSISWWTGVCCKTNLKDIATAILEMPATSAATERSFSAFSFIHCKKRNKLTTERAGKILFIAHNSKLLNMNEPVPKNTQDIQDIAEAGPSNVNQSVNQSQINKTTSNIKDSERSGSESSDTEPDEDYSVHDTNSSDGPEDFSDLDMEENPN